MLLERLKVDLKTRGARPMGPGITVKPAASTSSSSSTSSKDKSIDASCNCCSTKVRYSTIGS